MRFLTFICFAGICALTAVVYAPGLSGVFVLDDFPNIVGQPAIQASDFSVAAIRRALGETATNVTGRPVAVLTIMANHVWGGLSPAPFLLTNILIHLLTVGSLWCFASTLWRASGRQTRWPPLLATAIWALHPINLTAVLYVVQRMTSLSALFVLLALAVFLRFRVTHRPSNASTIVSAIAMGTFSLLGVLSKENAVLIPGLLLASEWVIRERSNQRGSLVQRRAVWLVGAAPFALLLVYVSFRIPEFAASYSHWPFSMSDRLLTETRVLWMYLGLVASPRISDMTLYHDGLTVSSGFLSPQTTLAAIVAWAGVIVTLIALRRRVPWLFFGLCFYLIGHLLESTLIPLEIAFEHRNYLPIAGLIAGVAFQCADWVDNGKLKMPVLASISAAVILLLAFQTFQRAALWGRPAELLAHEVQENPVSPRVQHNAGRILWQVCNRQGLNPSDSACQRASLHFEQAAALDTANAGSLIAAIEVRHSIGEIIDTSKLLEVDRRLRWESPRLINATMLRFAMMSDGDDVALPPLWLANWAESALANTRIRKIARVAVLTGYAQLLQNRMQRPDEALLRMSEAADLAPNSLVTQVTLAQLLATTARTTELQRQIIRIESMPGAWAYSEPLNDLRHQAATLVKLNY